MGNDTYPATYYDFDGTYVYFRERVDGDPSGPDGFSQYSWVVLVNTDGDPTYYEWVIALDGKGEQVKITENTSKTGGWKDQAEGTPQGNYSTSTYARIVSATDSNFDSDSDYFVDWVVLWDSLKTWLGIDETTVNFLFATSANYKNYNKDIVGGNRNSFSDAWGSDTSLPVELSIFTATSEDGAVTLFWRTESEVNCEGFNIYRSLSPDGPYQKVNPHIIQGAGNSPIRHDYSYTDTRLTNGVTYYYRLEDVDLDGTKTMHGPIFATPQAEERGVMALPEEYDLSQNFPNPFNLETRIDYQLPESVHVLLRVYNLRGQLIRTLVAGDEEAGWRQIRWDGRDDWGLSVSSGVYFYRMEAGDFVSTRKACLIR